MDCVHLESAEAFYQVANASYICLTYAVPLAPTPQIPSTCAQLTSHFVPGLQATQVPQNYNSLPEKEAIPRR
jgi:hypothetical protein